jgi:exodeoxyribonuclease X
MKYIFLDTETTSATPERGVVEVAFVVTDENFNVIEEVSSLIDPQQMISPSASGVHGLTNKDVDSCPTLAEFFSNAGAECYGGPIKGPAVLIGHRVSFDTHTIGPYVDGGYTELCSLRWARKVYPSAEDHKLSTMVFALDLPRSAGAHRALADVYSAMHLVRHLCDRTGLSLKQMAEASADPMEIRVVPFGKYKDQPFSAIPRSYLQWMLREIKDLDMDMRYSIDLALNNKKKNHE